MRYGGCMTTEKPPRKRKPRPAPSAPFIGGPLDGQTFVKHFGGRWRLYLDNRGEYLVARRGDQIQRTGDPAGCYVLREELDETTETVTLVYRHTSAPRPPLTIRPRPATP